MTIRVPLTRDDMREAIQSVHVVLPKFALTEDTMGAVTDAYRSVMLPLDREAVAAGAMLGLRGWDKFPTPHQWREAIREWIKHNRITLDRDEDVLRDAEVRAIICRTCRSVARSAWLRRADGTEYSRLVAPCTRERHAMGERLTDVPDNFVRWDDRPAAERFAVKESRL